MDLRRFPGGLRTSGLLSQGQQELELLFDDMALEQTAREMLLAIIRYSHDAKRSINATETMAWATSIIRFDRDDDRLRLMRLRLRTEEFSQKLDPMLRDWKAQRDACGATGSKYRNTELIDMIIVSAGMLSDASVAEGVRYPSRMPYSGWWLFGDDYTGDVSKMHSIHVGDLLTHRPGLRKYLALDYGFCFSETPDERVWFEEGVAEEPVV